MAVSQTIQWRRITIESVAIVLSILLAFAIDAWWEERRERDHEAEILVGLDNEFRGIRTLIEDKLSQYEKMKTSIGQLLIAHERGAWEYDAVSIDLSMQWLISPTSIEFGGGVLDAVVSAGRLEIISDVSLRAKLAGWQAVIDEVRDDELRNAGYIFNQILPYIARAGVSTGHGARELYGEWPIATVSINEDLAGVDQLWNDPEFKTILEIRYEYIMHTMDEYDVAYEAADHILADIFNAGNP